MEKSSLEQVSDNLMNIEFLLTKSHSRLMKQFSHLSPGMIYVMRSLRKHGILSMSDIGKCQSMPKPHVTIIVDKLIDAGLAERLSDPNDRRIINIRLTEKGEEEYDLIKTTVIQGLRDKLALLSSEDIEKMVAASAYIREVVNNILG